MNKEIDKIKKELNDPTKEIETEINQCSTQRIHQPKDKARLEKRKEKLLKRREELQDLKSQQTTKTAKEQEKMQINVTTPSTSKMQKRNGHWIQGVNVQIVGNQDQISLCHLVDRSASDSSFLELMYDKLCRLFSVVLLWFHLLADSGYMSHPAMNRFDPVLGYKVIVPTTSMICHKRGKRMSAPGGGGWRFEDGFSIDTTKDVLICPQGKPLHFRGIYMNGKKPMRNYKSTRSDCDACPKRQACLGRIKSRIKKITFRNTSEAEKRFKEYCETSENKTLYKKRMQIIEPMNSQIFYNVGIRELHTIEESSIKGEIALLILLHTLKKVEKYHGSYLPIELAYYFLSYIIRFIQALKRD